MIYFIVKNSILENSFIPAVENSFKRKFIVYQLFLAIVANKNNPVSILTRKYRVHCKKKSCGNMSTSQNSHDFFNVIAFLEQTFLQYFVSMKYFDILFCVEFIY